MDNGNGIIFGAGGGGLATPPCRSAPTLSRVGHHHHGRLAAASSWASLSWTTATVSSSVPGTAVSRPLLAGWPQRLAVKRLTVSTFEFIGYVNLSAHDLAVKRLSVSTFKFYWGSSTSRPTTRRSSGSRFRPLSVIGLRQFRGPRPGGQASHSFDVHVSLVSSTSRSTTLRSSGSGF
jgi:hypothetical protein